MNILLLIVMGVSDSRVFVQALFDNNSEENSLWRATKTIIKNSALIKELNAKVTNVDEDINLYSLEIDQACNQIELFFVNKEVDPDVVCQALSDNNSQKDLLWSAIKTIIHNSNFIKILNSTAIHSDKDIGAYSAEIDSLDKEIVVFKNNEALFRQEIINYKFLGAGVSLILGSLFLFILILHIQENMH